MKKRIILTARYYSIEPLGILYLAGLVRQMGWECKVVLIKGSDFKPLYDEVLNWKPNLVGFQVWTGYHLSAFSACDKVRLLGVPVVIGGPHATYFGHECAQHADWVLRGSAFGLLRKLLEGSLAKGVHFDKTGRSDTFPLPDRGLVYDAYPEIGASPIKSMFASVGCPFFCTYCYASSFNKMHGGFALIVRSVDDIISEARAILEKWPLKLVYFQDDIFGYDLKWLTEFASRWSNEVRVPFHCQLRLELTRGENGDTRLDLLRQAGCSGITIAIESGNKFLRAHVLFRHMRQELILEGCKKILDRGMKLRTEQILAVPFSDTDTDMSTLNLNCSINPTMAWTSILAPYGGTDMGIIADNFGLYTGNNDDLSETFFDRSILKHVDGGPRDIEAIVDRLGVVPTDRTLLRIRAVQREGEQIADVFYEEKKAGEITYLDAEANEKYCDSTVRLQRLFFWLAKVPEGESLGRKLLAIPECNWTWENIGKTSVEHLVNIVGPVKIKEWMSELAVQIQCDSGGLTVPVAQNPAYFIFFPAGGIFARKAMERGVFNKPTTLDVLSALNTMTRQHLFDYDLYMIKQGEKAIA